MKLKIYNCSNSAGRPPHRSESFGPKENDIIRGLKSYCNQYDAEFIDNPILSNVIITNDIFPSEIVSLGKPLIKRMDGIYWDRNRDRNEPLNKAARQAEHVIFISEYSRDTYFKMYGQPLKQHSVVLNQMDNNVFYSYKGNIGKELKWAAAASNWSRPEKRFNDLLVFSDMIRRNGETLHLIGNCDIKELPDNIIKEGYIDDENTINYVLNGVGAFVNLSYRDPAPKVVCQAVNVGLPVLFADSGGTNELVKVGTGIYDKTDDGWESETPRLTSYRIERGYNMFKEHFYRMRDSASGEKRSYQEMLKGYFDVMRKAVTK